MRALTHALPALALLTLIAVPVPAFAQDWPAATTLGVGDAAPSVSVAEWVKGDAVALEAGKVYVVEFWATWCGPCVRSMPHLSEIQEHYGDKVTVIGVTREDPNNSLAQVKEMVAAKGAGMGYTVAWDDAGKTYSAYMAAAGQRGIPTSFVVDAAGKIAFIGHPSQLDFVLKRVVAGTWDAAKGKEELAAIGQRMQTAFTVARDNPKDALTKLDAILGEYPELKGAYVPQRMQLLMMGKQWDGYLEAARVAVARDIKYGNPMGLNQIAWTIVDPEGSMGKKDLDLALEAASAAVKLTKGEDGAILDTLARVHFLRGEVEKALELQTRAVKLQEAAVAKAEQTGNEGYIQGQKQMLEGLTKALEEYKAALGRPDNGPEASADQEK